MPVLNATRESMIFRSCTSAGRVPALWTVKPKEQNKEGLPRDSPSIVFAAAVAFTGRPPQRRPGSSYKAPAYDNETLDHLLSLLKTRSVCWRITAACKWNFSARAANSGVNFSLRIKMSRRLCIQACGMRVSLRALAKGETECSRSRSQAGPLP